MCGSVMSVAPTDPSRGDTRRSVRAWGGAGADRGVHDGDAWRLWVRRAGEEGEAALECTRAAADKRYCLRRFREGGGVGGRAPDCGGEGAKAAALSVVGEEGEEEKGAGEGTGAVGSGWEDGRGVRREGMGATNDG